MKKETLTILVIDRSQHVVGPAMRRAFEAITRRDGRKGEVLFADSIVEARRIFEAHPELDGMVTNGSLEGGTKLGDGGRNEPDVEIIQFIGSVRLQRPRFPIIAASNSDICRTKLLRSGCTAECTKFEALDVLLYLLQRAE